jgi:hypothetical protein
MAGPRESIWSVTRRTGILYFVTFSFVVTISVILLTIHETAINDRDTFYATIRSIGITSAQMSPAWVVFSLVLAELGDWTMVLAEMFREKLRKDQELRAQEERAEGRAEGLVEGFAESHAQWEAWNTRRVEAERNNLPFNEPPPSLDDSQNGSVA